jgi:hypothetical protein
MNKALQSNMWRITAFIAGAALSMTALAASGTAYAQTTGATSTASTTAMGPQVSNVLVWNNLDGMGATVTWTTDVPATSQIFYGDTPNTMMNSSTTPDTELVTSHSAELEDLMPSTLYYFMIMSSNSAGTTNPIVHYVFMTNEGFVDDEDDDDDSMATSTTTSTATSTASSTGMTNATSTATSTGTTLGGTNTNINSTSTATTTATTTTTVTATSTESMTLQERVAMLESQVSALQAQIAALMSQIQSLLSGGMGGTGGSGSGGTTNTGSSGTTTSSVGQVWITPQNASVRAGTSIDFNGRGFRAEESVSVMSNGMHVGTAHADGGGNFSTGSMPVGNTTGSRTYTFVGSQSGLTGSATYNVTQ